MKHLAKAAAAAAIILSAMNASPATSGEAPKYTFEGGYAGAFGGFGSAQLEGTVDSREAVDCDAYDNSTSPCAEEGETFDGNGDHTGTFGGFAGYNIAHSGLILGVEVDFGSFGVEDDAIDAGGNDYSQQEINWIGSLRARVGMQPDDKTLVFGTAGVAYIDSSFTANNNMDECSNPGSGDCETGETDTSQFVPVVGGGIERFVTENIALRAEGLYYVSTSSRDFDADELTSDMDSDDFAETRGVYQVRAGISYRF